MKNHRPVSGDGSAPVVLNPDAVSGFTTPGNKARTTAEQFFHHGRSLYHLLLHCWRALAQFPFSAPLKSRLTETPLKQTETFQIKLKRFRSYQRVTQKFAETFKILKIETVGHPAVNSLRKLG